MSAPGDSGPTQGYYPDPSIPGYIRYWNGAAWVPGTSRPAPNDGEALPAPPAGGGDPDPYLAPTEEPPIASTQQAGVIPDETGPMFFDEQPAAGSHRDALPELRPRGEVGVSGAGDAGPTMAPAGSADVLDWDEAQQLHGARPEPGGGWHADASRQAGFGGESDQRISWGADDVTPFRPAAASAWGDAPAWGDPPADPRVVPPTGMGPAPAGARTGAGTPPAQPQSAAHSPAPAQSLTQSPAQPPALTTEPSSRSQGRELDAGATPRAALPAGATPSVPRQGGAPNDSAATAQPAGSGVAGERAQPGSAGVPAQAGGDGTLTIRAVPRGRGGQDAGHSGSAAPDSGQQPTSDGALGDQGTSGGRDGTLTIRALGRTGALGGADAATTPAATAPTAPSVHSPSVQSPPVQSVPVRTPAAQAPAAQTPAVQAPSAQASAALPYAAPHDGAYPQPVPGTQIPTQSGPPPGPAGPPAPPPAQPAMPGGGGAGAGAGARVGAGQADWARRVHDLAQPPGPSPAYGNQLDDVMPWKPPVDDPFLRAAQAQGRPAALGKRLGARLIDTVALGGLLATIALPLWAKAKDHIDEKVDSAKQSGETVTVYLLDGTTGTYLAIILAALLLLGVVYEVLPTAKWGRTLGKRLCGVRVLDIEDHATPTFATALRRWLVYGVLGLLVVGVANVVWCLFDRPWRQCWHDKAARTFVASNER
ncbi:RDD family protein [Streptomyces zagrosensis]|uniref:Putative RDD family membrane protein YckC n=1 Tax=Streptomyces zagrosensis TaxID=1042984 RepID=A0A7W9Q7U9_9ACTN|nr:RDD family protein [Streptomyces zagrosensis]MBB5935216.1 putative RDD family membrane protein YckC [Streptomyces zagrosensis]